MPLRSALRIRRVEAEELWLACRSSPSRIGAEFVPQLDEGDVLVEARRLPGAALSESIASSERMEPEVANDVLGIEQTDV